LLCELNRDYRAGGRPVCEQEVVNSSGENATINHPVLNKIERPRLGLFQRSGVGAVRSDVSKIKNRAFN